MWLYVAYRIYIRTDKNQNTINVLLNVKKCKHICFNEDGYLLKYGKNICLAYKLVNIIIMNLFI